MIDMTPLLTLLCMVALSTFSVLLMMRMEGIKHIRWGVAFVCIIMLPILAFTFLVFLNRMVSVLGGNQQITYASSMGQYEPVHGLIHLECHNGNPNEHRSLDARALGITMDKDEKIRILIEPNDAPPNQYSHTSYWLKDAGLCQAYVR